MKRLLSVLALLAVVTVLVIVITPKEALAAFAPTRILNLYVLNKLLVGNATESNAMTKTVVSDIDFDFASATTTCVDTPAFPATGVKKSDPCFVGNGPRDGGVQIALTANGNFSATSNADDTVILRFCAAGTAANPVDAGYVVRCISSL